MPHLRGMPPHGIAGHAQQTIATHYQVAKPFTGKATDTNPISYNPRRPRKPARAKSNGTSRVAKKARSYTRVGKMKKGSAAAKAWGRKMKRMRGR